MKKDKKSENVKKEKNWKIKIKMKKIKNENWKMKKNEKWKNA